MRVSAQRIRMTKLEKFQRKRIFHRLSREMMNDFDVRINNGITTEFIKQQNNAYFDSVKKADEEMETLYGKKERNY